MAQGCCCSGTRSPGFTFPIFLLAWLKLGILLLGGKKRPFSGYLTYTFLFGPPLAAQSLRAREGHCDPRRPYKWCGLFRRGGQVPTANRTVATCTRRTRRSDSTCLIRTEGHPVPEAKTPVRRVLEQPQRPKHHPHGQPKILQWGELCKPCSFQDTDPLLAAPRVTPSGPESGKEDGKRGQSHGDSMPGCHPTAAQWSQHLGCGWRHKPKPQVQLDGGNQT